MLRRRILASAMASVMAIGSVAVVASADDTAASTALVKSAADLEAYIKTFDSFRDDGIYDYGTVAGKQFQNTIDFAENVLADGKATIDDYTAAYQMLKSVYESLKKYTAEELKALIDGNRKTRDTENIMNEDLSDLIYEEGSFATFADAYDYAETVVDSGDTRLISDAYLDLKNAVSGLNALPVITKAQFRSVLKKYEAIIDNASDYDDWRRGSVSGWFDGEYTPNYWALQQAVDASGVTTFGAVKRATLGDGQVEMGGWQAACFPIDITTYGDVQTYVTAIYDELVQIKSVNKTTGEQFIKAYTIAERAAATFNAFTPDSTNRAAKASVTKILDQYHKQLVAKYRADDAEAAYLLVNADKTTVPKDWKDADNDYFGAELKNEGRKGTWTIDGEEVTIAKGISILKYINITSADVTNAATSAAMAIAEEYLAGNYSATVYGLDDTGKVTTGNGSIQEWTLVYRNLFYALTDEFKGAKEATYTKRQVIDFVNKEAYDLAELTGDAAIFNDEHMALVDVRQAALDWIRQANKDRTYKDGKEIDGQTSTDVYKALKDAYDTLNKKLSQFKYSYGEVFYKISEVLDKIDSNDGLTMTDSMKAAIDEASVALALVEATTKTANEQLDNDAYTTDRVFLPYNRIFTDTYDNVSPNGSEKRLKDAYEALLAEVKKQETPEYKLGDVNKDGNVNAFDAAAILKAVADGTTDKLENADYDGNKTVNALDAAAILKAVANA